MTNLRIPFVSFTFPVFCYVFIRFYCFSCFSCFHQKFKAQHILNFDGKQEKHKKTGKPLKKTKKNTGNNNETQGIHMFSCRSFEKLKNSLCFVYISCFLLCFHQVFLFFLLFLFSSKVPSPAHPEFRRETGKSRKTRKPKENTAKNMKLERNTRNSYVFM